MNYSAIYPKIPLAQTIIAHCKHYKVEHIVISPGSRNAPLTIGFTHQDFFKCYSIADERCAAFFALGMAQQLQKPVAVVCTSGSALLNYYPAVAEAFYSQIPLIVISADRPFNKIDIGDGQTIRQQNVFKNHILYNANLTAIASDENNYKISKALHNSIIKKGPVHINAPFEEPLYEVTSSEIEKIKFAEHRIALNKVSVPTFIVDKWNKAQKKLIIIGELFPNTIKNYIIEKLASDKSVLVLTEKSSNIYHNKFIDRIDTLITSFKPKEIELFNPDVLLTFGGMVVSKRIKSLLREIKPKEHWHINELRAYDTYGVLSHHFKMNINDFFSKILTDATLESNYQELFLSNYIEKLKKQEIFSESVLFSDFYVFNFLAKNLKDNYQIQVSNSSSIRYIQLFNFGSNKTFFCNRGTSGIDGSTSTAIGAAIHNKIPTVFITGDISFLYDSNALWNNYIPKNFKIIIVNNSGGGIFRILPGFEENKIFSTFFETNHNFTMSNLAKMYDIDYFIANDEKSLKSAFNLFINNSEPSILEIITPTHLNEKVLKNYFNFIK